MECLVKGPPPNPKCDEGPQIPQQSFKINKYGEVFNQNHVFIGYGVFENNGITIHVRA